MKEVKLSPSHVHNFCLSVLISGVCLLFDNGNSANFSPEICQSIQYDYLNKLSLKTFWVPYPTG